MTATGDHYMTFYVVTQKLPEGLTPKATLEVVDNSAKPQVTNAWYDKERPLITKNDGLSQYGAMTQVELPSMTMSRPYSDAQDVEEIWIATEGDVDMLVRKRTEEAACRHGLSRAFNGKDRTREYQYFRHDGPISLHGEVRHRAAPSKKQVACSKK